MANVLATLFKDIANAIRYKTGESDEVLMMPKEFPQKIMDISVSGGGDDVDSILDNINGEIIGENQYHVTFIGADGSELCKVPVYDGYDCEDPIQTGTISTPTKASTKYYSYTFSGWSFTDGGSADSTALLTIEKDTTLYAAFTQATIYIARGQLSSTIEWSINPDYVLRIAGSGAMDDFNYTDFENRVTNAPWFEYGDSITSITIDSGITEIANRAFVGCSNASAVSLPEGLKTIGMQSFLNCTSITSITIPTSVFHIQTAAFENCDGLTSITIPYGTRSLFVNVFSGCDNLTSVIFERTTGWKVTDTDEEISSDIIGDPAAAATYLTSGLANTEIDCLEV